jgi:hypothetical protein
MQELKFHDMTDPIIQQDSNKERVQKAAPQKPPHGSHKSDQKRGGDNSLVQTKRRSRGNLLPPAEIPDDRNQHPRNPYSLIVVIPIFLIGLSLFSCGILAGGGPAVPWWGVLAKEAGAVLMVVAVIHLIYELYIHRILHGDIRRLGVTVQTLQRTVSIVGGAIESGLAAVYSSREESNKAMMEQMDRMRPGSKLRILGISCGAFLCPHGALHGAFRKALEIKGATVEALILDIGSDAAVDRARIEEPHIFGKAADRDKMRESYTVTRCHNELKTATDFAQDLADRCYIRDSKPLVESEAQRMAPTEPPVLASFSYKVYSTAPICYLVIFEDSMFLETYHNAGRGGEAPMLKIARHSGDSPEHTSLFKIYEKHFEKMRELSRDRANEVHNQRDTARGIIHS